MRPLHVVLAVILALLLPAAAHARPTVSGTLEAYNPGARRLQIKRDDGALKTVVLRENAAYEVYGNKVAPTYFKPGMKVAVRITGSLGDDPLEADLLTDYGSSGRYVSRSATSPYNTPVGNYATGGGAGGVSPGLPQLGGPSVLGPLGHGGNFPGSLTNPMGGAVNNSAFPAIPQMQPGSGMGAQPAPGGSPFTGEVVAGQSQPGAAPGGVAPGPGGMTSQPSPYGQPGPYGASSMVGGGNPADAMSPGSLMGGNDDEEDEEGGGFQAPNAGGPMGMQIVQFQARVMTADAANRVLTVVPAGAAYPLQVSLPPGLYPVHQGTGQAVPVDGIRPGQGVVVHGLTNAAGIVEARQVQVTQ